MSAAGYKDIGAYAEACFRDTPPPCSAACPLGVDVRGLVSKVKAGRSGAAFRAYRDAVLFPNIVSTLCDAPCAEVCVRAVQAEQLSTAEQAERNTAAEHIAGAQDTAVDQAGQNDASRRNKTAAVSGEAVDLRRIEQGVCAAAERRAPARYAIPKKAERVAVIGGGASGLACAQRLASKGYAVTLYEAADAVGGSVRGRLPDGAIEEDLSLVLGLADLHVRLAETVVAPESGETCDSARQKNPVPRGTEFEAIVSQSDAVYIATGAGGDDFGLLEGTDARTLATRRSGVFLGGSLAEHKGTKHSVAESIENGLRAAAAIEEYLLTGRADGNAELFDRKPADPHYYDLVYDWKEHKGDGRLCENSVIAGADPQSILQYQLLADAVAEAARCPECNCSACIDACTMIRWFRQNPKRIAADLEVTLLPVDGKIKHVASRMLNSCNLCGLCGAVCPAGVDTGVAMQEARRLMRQGGNIPPAFHDYWLKDMAFSLSEEAYAVVLPEGRSATASVQESKLVTADMPAGKAVASVVFFPGCQLAASLPGTVIQTFEYLRGAEPGAAMILSCCGVPADWAGERDALDATIAKIRADWEAIGRPPFLFACATCKKTFEKYLPEAEGRLIYEWLADDCRIPCGIPQIEPLFHAESETFSTFRSSVVARDTGIAAEDTGIAAVYDPCAARHDEGDRAAVRSLAAALGFELREDLPLNGEHAACCGFGGHIYPANPGLLDAVIEERRSETPVITYCANCRDLFLSKGYAATHILEHLFGNGTPADSETTGAPRRLPTLSERRDNRRAVKDRFCGSRVKPGMTYGALGMTEDGALGMTEDGALVIAAGEPQSMDPGSAPGMTGSAPGMTGAAPGMTEAAPGMTYAAPGIEDKMDRLLLLREDVYAAIAYCEETGEKLLDTDNGHFIGCRAGRVTTVWVEYEVAEGHESGFSGTAEETAGFAFTLHNVYTHRMRIEGQGAGESYHGPNSELRDGDKTEQGSETRLICAKCREALLLLETKFTYLGHDFTHKVPRCPSCGLVYISEELATGKIAEVEAMLEDK
ncbi:MAG: NAD(P)-binding protein [Clostridiales Family XIII bacterium]|jgi:Fe-S oxidoreductase|nr:NAD(P)-binding protein [Clostridiales Family XIII bacterium]